MNTFDDYRERLLTELTHRAGCEHSNNPAPLNEAPCDCYEEGIFNTGAVAALRAQAAMFIQSAEREKVERQTQLKAGNGRKASACNYAAQMLLNHAAGLEQLANRITVFK